MDLNLNTLKQEILEYLESREFAVFRSAPGVLEGNALVLWDVEKYPDYQFSIIMGGDSFQNLHKWKNFESIIKNYAVFVYNRPGFEISNHVNAKLTVVDAPLLEISATQIRSLIKDGKSIRYMVPDKVKEEIEKGGYYKK